MEKGLFFVFAGQNSVEGNALLARTVAVRACSKSMNQIANLQKLKWHSF